MYESLVSWCKFPVNIKAFMGRTGTGDIQYAEPVVAMGYQVDDTKTITDKLGKEYVSRSRFYLKPDTAITDADLIYADGEKPREIRKLGGYYDGNTGKLSIWVVYL